MEDGKVTELTYNEYLELLSGEVYHHDDGDSSYSVMRGQRYFQFDPSTTTTYFAAPQYVSPCYEGGAYGGAVMATSSVVTTVSYSISLSATAKDVIFNKIALSFNIGKSLSSAIGNAAGGSYNVPDGKYGKVQFRAKLVKTVGTLTEYDLKNNATTPTVVSTQTVTMIAPVALPNGLCDGLYTLVVKDHAF